ncbi:metallophosphoesterase family protein [Papillibacter cinnamivorans]|uniref:DNA repair exonuclease SbcCD nuclease subunit n=1 Tax=Papillibacter cinnamivorans DSM 12816 TaxID=1122930 RepID=A0A1W2BQT2_9FIRM|nr:metallophosphoesterase [Papillibacter cinnamivorans]SMC75074.1 DNA repair exonuclease SbcCD nuclease subunit [Papillibacter cinnamivorans DSM 12816]
MIRLIHAADFHLDSPYDALSPEQAVLRRKEGRELLDRLYDLARETRADLLLLAGDLFDCGTVFYETTEAMVRVFGRIGAKIFIAPGNHDYYSPGSPYGTVRWPENVHIFRSGVVERVILPELGCAVYGAGFTSPLCSSSLLSGFSAAKDGLTNLMVLHGDLGAADPRYNPISESDIASSGLAYLALGHKHAFGGVQKAGSTRYAYSGCPEGRGFDELGEKGVLVGEIDDTVRLRFYPIAKRRYEILKVDLTESSDPAKALLAVLPTSAENDIYRIILTGESAAEDLNLVALTALVKDRFFSVTLRDSTSVRRYIWEQAGEDTLRGLFLRRMREKMDAAGEEEREKLALAVRFGLAALDNREEPL